MENSREDILEQMSADEREIFESAKEILNFNLPELLSKKEAINFSELKPILEQVWVSLRALKNSPETLLKLDGNKTHCRHQIDDLKNHILSISEFDINNVGGDPKGHRNAVVSRIKDIYSELNSELFNPLTMLSLSKIVLYTTEELPPKIERVEKILAEAEPVIQSFPSKRLAKDFWGLENKYSRRALGWKISIGVSLAVFTGIFLYLSPSLDFDSKNTWENVLELLTARFALFTPFAWVLLNGLIKNFNRTTKIADKMAERAIYQSTFANYIETSGFDERKEARKLAMLSITDGEKSGKIRRESDNEE